LSSLWHNAGVDGFVDHVETVAEGFIKIADSMQLSIVWTHDSAIVAKQLFAGVTKELELFVVQHTYFGHCHIRILETAEGGIGGCAVGHCHVHS